MHQVGYLQRLYRDARSTEHKINYLLQHVRVTIVSMETQRNNAPFVLLTYILRCRK
jgi:hypothetical protein